MIEIPTYVSPMAIPGLADTEDQVIVAQIQITKMITLEEIADVICEYFELSFDKFTGKDRHKQFAYARQLYCYFAMKFTRNTIVRIGKVIKRDHATVLHSRRVVQNLLDVRDDYNKLFNYQIIENKVRHLKVE